MQEDELPVDPGQINEPPAEPINAEKPLTEQTGDVVTVEQRDGKFVACYLLRGIELAPVFDLYETAEEVGRKCADGEAFFNRIPTVKHGTPIPRPKDAGAAPYRSPREVVKLGNRGQGLPPQRPRGTIIQRRPNG